MIGKTIAMIGYVGMVYLRRCSVIYLMRLRKTTKQISHYNP
jgi:hypothetical protein